MALVYRVAHLQIPHREHYVLTPVYPPGEILRLKEAGQPAKRYARVCRGILCFLCEREVHTESTVFKDPVHVIY